MNPVRKKMIKQKEYQFRQKFEKGGFSNGMKKIIIVAGVLILALGFLVKDELLSTAEAVQYIKTHAPPDWPISDPLCLRIKVKFNADPQWKENGGKRYIMAGCDGQGIWKPNRPGCTGGLVKIKPGETATLGRCSCFFEEGGGCLKIGKELTIEDQKNGYRKRRNVTVVKPLSDTAECNVKVTNKKGKVLTEDGEHRFICGSNEQKKEVNVNINCKPKECPGPQKVTNVKVECPNCEEAAE